MAIRTNGSASPRQQTPAIPATSPLATGSHYRRLRIQMELATLSSRYGNFFAPAFAVRVGRDDLTRDLFLAVSQVEVDLVLGASTRFTFTVVNSYSAEDRTFMTGRGRKVLELLKFGAEVDMSIGYGHPN